MTTLCAGTLAVLLPNTFVLPFVDNAIIAKSSARTLVLVLVINLQWNMCAVVLVVRPVLLAFTLAVNAALSLLLNLGLLVMLSWAASADAGCACADAAAARGGAARCGSCLDVHPGRCL